MSIDKLVETVCGFPQELLISQTPMVCRLLLKSSGSIPHKHQSVKKWMNYLTRLLVHKNNEPEEEEQDFLSFDDSENKNNKNKNKNKHKNKKEESICLDLNKIWSSLCLLSTTYRIITSGYSEWNKHCNIILDLTENELIFYNPILRTRCFETLYSLIQYSRFETNMNSYQLSLQISSKFARFLQNILIEIVLNKNKSLNCGGKLLENVLMILYRLLSNNKSLNSKINIAQINKICFRCLISNNHKITSIANNIIIVLCNNDKKYNEMIDKISHTLNYLLIDIFPSNIMNKKPVNINKMTCISDIIDILPSFIEIDSFKRISLFNNIMNGLIFLLSHLFRKKYNKSSNDSQSFSCSMNSYLINIPLKNIFMFIINITSISINHSFIKSNNLLEYNSFLCSLYENALWLLTIIITTLQKSILPYSNLINYIIITIAKETKELNNIRIRQCLYECLQHILPIFGASMYDILYNDLRIHLINDLKSAAKLLQTSPPNVKNNPSKEKLITAKKKQKIENGIYLQREYGDKLSFYCNVLSVIGLFFTHCSNYMAFSEKGEIELILSSTLLSCYSESGHILINLYLIDLLNEFIALMSNVLMTAKLYKKPYLSLSYKLLSSSLGIGTILTNDKLIKNSQNGLKYIESVVNPRSIPVYNKPLKIDKAINKQITWNRKRTFSQMENDDYDNNNDDGDEEEDDDEDMDDNDNVEPLWSY